MTPNTALTSHGNAQRCRPRFLPLLAAIGCGQDPTAPTTPELETQKLVTGDAVYCWGYNGLGQLGDGTTTNHPTPKLIVSRSTWD